MSTYRYLFYDVLSNEATVELPLFGTFFSRELNKAGTGTCSVQLDMEGIRNVDVIDGTIPGRTKLYVERNGKIVWGGILWTRTWQEQSKTFNCNLQTIESFFAQQYIEASLSYVGVDQRNVLIRLIQDMQAKPSANIGLVLPEEFPLEISRLTNFFNYDGWSYQKAIEYMIKYDQGFDYTIESSWGADDKPQDVVLIGNVLGEPLETTGAFFDYPGNIKNFYFPENTSRSAVTSLGFGKGEGTGMVRSKYTNPGLLEAGYPDIQQAFDNKDVSVQSTLDSQNKASAELLCPPITAPTLELDPSQDLGSWKLGDYSHTNIVSSRFPDGFELSTRIIGYNLTPTSKSGAEEVKLVIAGAED